MRHFNDGLVKLWNRRSWSPSRSLVLGLALGPDISVLSTSLVTLHCVPKNDTDVTHYRFNPHQPISVILGRNVAERVCY